MVDDKQDTVIFENFPNGESYIKNSPSMKLYSKVITQENGTYVFDVAKSSGTQSTIAASLSSNDIQLHSLEELKYISTLKGHKKTITGIKFNDQERNLLFSSSLDGSLCIWDTRQNYTPAVTLSDDSNAKLKRFTSFDVLGPGWWLLCAGTELVREDAFLVFWDVRKQKNLGGYWNSHTDDITQVKFHPKKPNIMSSGSMDGLINVYDLSEDTEDDALLYTLNIGSSVGKLNWCSLNPMDMLSCVTGVEEHQLWCIEEAKPCSLFGKESFAKSLMTKCGVDYLIDTFEENHCLYLATGTNNGDLQIWKVDEEKFSLSTELIGGHKGIVRTVLWDCEDEILITGSEDGSICCWKLSSESPPSKSNSKLKIISHLKQLTISHLKKPY